MADIDNNRTESEIAALEAKLARAYADIAERDDIIVALTRALRETQTKRLHIPRSIAGPIQPIIDKLPKPLRKILASIYHALKRLVRSE
ncbi:hypothetical protein [Trueperella pecoris]|uniref:Uncharacterized protein n=1 Tax=Trueperella pecoris TaxID=2733571 RepID=A0A7M1QTK6_9ACTO|nr:hypothetical protein [Trueperella pecoris]QOR45196.1 hypothetical protein INS88_07895 [Trueperella pecoris]